ncbi:MAG: oxidoreductase [Verrucomicrobiales bacterium]|jgi:predicted dehydrogenase|nr:oxidoreductase [Verrucomicrobiales bacterium]
MSDKLRCAVIGTGAFGTNHLVSLSACPRATIVALAESDPQRAKEAGERFKIPRTYSDYRELLEQPDIDAVTIATPNHLHAPVALAALQARKHVLLEKPMATASKDAVKIIETAKKMKRVVMVAQNFRFNRHTQLAKMAIERGTLGEVYHARGFWLRRNGIPRIGSWFTQKQFAGGGCTFDIGVHVLDACLHLMGDFDIQSVSAHTHAKFGPRGLGEFEWGKSAIDAKRTFDVDDFSTALLRTRSGKSIVLEVAWAAFTGNETREHGIDLLGTNAGLSLYPAKLFRNGPEGYEEVFLNQPKLPYSEDRIHHFVSSILDGTRPLVKPEESLAVLQVLEAIYKSSASGKEVRFSK